MTRRTLVLLGIPCLLAAAPETREEILVVVNGHAITRRVFQQAVEQATAAFYRQFSGKELDAKLRDAREKTLRGMIDAFIIQDQAADLGIVVRDEDLRSSIEEIKKQNNFTSDADFERALKGSLGISLKDYLARMKQDVVKQEVLRRKVYSQIAIEEQELKAWYLDHLQDYARPDRYRIRELVLAKGGSAEEKAAVQTRIAAIQAALAKGESFEAMVKEHSTSTSRSTGGDLGWVGKGILHGVLEQAALALKPEQVSGLLETDKNFYFVQLIEAEIGTHKPFTEVRAAILEKLQEPKAENAIENYLNGQRIRTNIRYMVSEEEILKG